MCEGYIFQKNILEFRTLPFQRNVVEGFRQRNACPRKVKEKCNILESVIKNNLNPLDYPITQQELSEKLKSIKSKKACSLDNIKNEMLKNSTPELQNAVLKLFNMVLTSGCFPEVWNQGLTLCLSTKVETNQTPIITGEFASTVTWERFSVAFLN